MKATNGRAPQSRRRAERTWHRVVTGRNPSAGKSAIGAILSTIASEDLRHTVFNLTSPRDFEASWNPNEPGRFYWIDDAFGSNVLREEYVQDWTAAFRKVQAAITRGNRFLLTSRRHIYEAAKIRLGRSPRDG